jgi:hypothetical protein
MVRLSGTTTATLLSATSSLLGLNKTGATKNVQLQPFQTSHHFKKIITAKMLAQIITLKNIFNTFYHDEQNRNNNE